MIRQEITASREVVLTARGRSFLDSFPVTYVKGRQRERKRNENEARQQSKWERGRESGVCLQIERRGQHANGTTPPVLSFLSPRSATWIPTRAQVSVEMTTRR
jgi:hypothetical protein